MDAAGKFFDDLAATCVDTAVSVGGGGGLPPWKMPKDQNASEKKEWRKSSGIESIVQSVTELGEAYTQAMANKHGTKQKHEVYPCRVCSNNISGAASIGCESCRTWAHAQCINLSYKFIGDINKGKRISIAAYCESCKSNDKYQEEVMKEIRGIKTQIGNTR